MNDTEKKSEAVLIIKEKAINRIKETREKKNTPDLMLRISVEGGGCSGFQYNLDWDSKKQDDDKCFAECVIIDNTSLSFLSGSSVDFVSTLMGEDFKILNPNAVSSCGCGTSFSV